MIRSTPVGLKSLSPLDARVLDLLKEVARPNRYIRYSEAIKALSGLRVPRRLALQVFGDFHRRGLVKASCGHGIKLVPEAEAREREREAET